MTKVKQIFDKDRFFRTVDQFIDVVTEGKKTTPQRQEVYAKRYTEKRSPDTTHYRTKLYWVHDTKMVNKFVREGKLWSDALRVEKSGNDVVIFPVVSNFMTTKTNKKK